MRKWMRDRMKRRKKTPEPGKGEAPQAPLQPAYFDAEVTAPAAPVQLDQPEAEPPEPQPAEPKEAQEPLAAEPQPGTSLDPRRRRRRGRGGRGRRGSPGSAPVPARQSSTEPGASAVTRAQQTARATKAPPTPPTSVAAPRASKGVVVLAIGLPGSGKSSWFKRHNITPLSSDMLRALLFDDPTEQRFQDLIFSNLRSMLKARLIARRPMNYVDTTNLTPHERQNWIKLASDYGYEVHAVFFDVPVEVCLQRNQRRQRVVPEDVMRRMAAKFKPPAFEEGFAKITVVKVKKKEGEPATN